MSDKTIVTVPDIGSDETVTVIEILVKVGDPVEAEGSLLTLESEKASMDIPSPQAGVVSELAVKVGDEVKVGSPLLTLKGEGAVSSEPESAKEDETDEAIKEETDVGVEELTQESSSDLLQLFVPDLGGAESVDVIEVLIKAGDSLEVDAPLVTLESEKASMDIPAVQAGVIESVSVKVGDKVSEGDLIGEMLVKGASSSNKLKKPAEEFQKVEPKPSVVVAETVETPTEGSVPTNNGAVYASPSIRRLAREFGVALSEVKGSGRKGRILKEDVQAFVKARLKQPARGVGLNLDESLPDFSKFGEVEAVSLNKIKRLTAENMRKSWLAVPHVTQFDEADITELEAFRKAKKKQVEQEGAKLTVLAFIVKAVVKALQTYPSFNSSLDAKNNELLYKKYFNIGIAVDTPNGLVVPVIKGADQLSVIEIAKEMGRLSELARAKKLMPKDMSGGSFTISSLGGISGTAFTPIVNSPEVAILGVSRAKMEPVFINGEFVPRLMLPLSLSYDHRVIDGAEAARFSALLANVLSDIRNLLI